MPGPRRRLKDLVKRVPGVGPALKGLRDSGRLRQRRARHRHVLAALQRGEDPGGGWQVGHEPTIRCNLRCYFCYQGDSRARRRAELAPAEVIRIYEGIPHLRCTKLVGGEIFVYRGLPELLAYLDDRQVRMTLQTNGTLLDPERVQELARWRHIRALIFSVDGPAQVHDQVRGHPGAFRKVMQAIRLVQEHMPWAEIGIFTVLLPENRPHMGELFQELATAGLRSVQVLFEQYYREEEITAARQLLVEQHRFPPEAVWINTNQRQEHPFAAGGLEEAIEEVRRLGRRHGVFVNLVPPDFALHPGTYRDGPTREGAPRVVCGKLLDREVRIDPSGQLLLCDVVEAPLGDLREQPLEALVRSERFQALQAHLLRTPLPVCHRCCKAVYL
jgi:MoaA/NifB/PqqE/SkfB family radical SAM enzyme